MKRAALLCSAEPLYREFEIDLAVRLRGRKGAGAAGFFRIGGGFLIVPGLMMATGMTLANVTASSLVSLAVFGASTASNYALHGEVDFRLAGLLLAGGAAGGGTGLVLSRALATRVRLARSAFSVLIVIVAVYFGWKAASSRSWTG